MARRSRSGHLADVERLRRRIDHWPRDTHPTLADAGCVVECGGSACARSRSSPDREQPRPELPIAEGSDHQGAEGAPRAEDNGRIRRAGAERTGVFTSGIVSTAEGHRIALFFTGVRHAGENLSAVLARRAAELPAPIQMCDALSRNTAENTVVANCVAHGRWKFVEVAENFPDQCRRVLETLREVYRNDDLAREQKMTPEERLRFHQAQSGPLMEELERWMRSQIDEHRVEPNSELGEAIGYMRQHWPKLPLFLRVPGAPLDNNVCERALNKAILHRKNALFYRTQNGARVGDIFMSLIHTAELNGVEPFHDLVALQRHRDEVVDAPAEWMPWNYHDTLAALNAQTGPSP